MTSMEQAFKFCSIRKPHTFVAKSGITPSSSGADFGSLEIRDTVTGGSYSLLTDDPDLLREIARKAAALAVQVEATNAVHRNRQTEKARPVDADAALAELLGTPDPDDVRNMPAVNVG